MVTPRKRRTQKSGKKNTRHNASKRMKVSFKGNAFIKANWDKKQTLTQNYRRLGLLTSLNGKAAGGTEKLYPEEQPMIEDQDGEEREPIDISKLSEEEIEELRKTLRPDEGLIQRDDEGNIIKIITGIQQTHDDILDAPIVPVEAKTDFVRQLEEQASNVHVGTRYTADGESRWLEKLIEKHDDDYNAMFWDKELNVNQLTANQLKKRIKNYLKNKSSE
ncbi:unnamed protein product [Cunninghamella blakesleeana]